MKIFCENVESKGVHCVVECLKHKREGFLSQFSIDSSFDYRNEQFNNTMHTTGKQRRMTRERSHGQILQKTG